MWNDASRYSIHVTPYTMTVVSSYDNKLQYGITGGIEFNYKTRHKIGLTLTYDNFLSRNVDNHCIGFRYHYIRAGNPIAKKHLLPLPRYHVGPPIALIMGDANHLPPNDQIVQTTESLCDEVIKAVRTDMITYFGKLDSYYTPWVRNEVLLLWAGCDYATRERIQLWTALREQLSARSIPRELQLIIRNKALLTQSRRKYLNNVSRLSGYHHFIQQGRVVGDITGGLFVMKPRHLDCLCDYLAAIRHDKTQLMAFMTGCVYYRTANVSED